MSTQQVTATPAFTPIDREALAQKRGNERFVRSEMEAKMIREGYTFAERTAKVRRHLRHKKVAG